MIQTWQKVSCKYTFQTRQNVSLNILFKPGKKFPKNILLKPGKKCPVNILFKPVKTFPVIIPLKSEKKCPLISYSSQAKSDNTWIFLCSLYYWSIFHCPLFLFLIFRQGNWNIEHFCSIFARYSYSRYLYNFST